jgi:hypothetical protein
MIVAMSDKFGRIFSGPEIESYLRGNLFNEFHEGFSCPICGKDVTYHPYSIGGTPDYFVHTDRSSDCFQSDSVSDDHRLATEFTVKSLYNWIRELTGKPVEIDVEKWIGVRENFIITDVRVSSPIRIAAEIFYRVQPLSLWRRLDTMFANSYRTYLVFHLGGCHDVDRIEQHLQKVAPLQLGRFNPKTLEVTLGDVFSKEQISLDKHSRELLPNYIA